MKVDSERRAAPTEKPRTDFKESLKKVEAKKTPPDAATPGVKSALKAFVKPAAGPLALGQTKTVFAEARAHANRIADVRATARVAMEAKVEKAQEVRVDGVTQKDQKTEQKVLELIGRELRDDRTDGQKEPAAMELKAAQIIHFQAPKNDATGAAATDEAKDAKINGILELVEKIRVFERQGRPAMAMSVGGSLDAHVEIERAGPKLVSLKLVGKNKIPSTAKLNELRDELSKRGIKVASLSVSAA